MLASSFRPILSWPANGVIPICFSGDVGGTGIRVRLSSVLDSSCYLDLPHIKTRSSRELVSVITSLDNILKTIVPGASFRGSALALAGPVKSHSSVTLTNWPGSAPERTVSLSDLPLSVFPPSRSIFLNDLEAGTYGVLSASDQSIIDNYFEQLWPEAAPRGPIVSDSLTAVFAMGSGLGVGLIVRTNGNSVVVPTELGHLQIPIVGPEHPNFANEKVLFDHASLHWSRGSHAPEFEDLASGRGLCLCYQFVMQRKCQRKISFAALDGAVIAANARAGDKLSKEAVTLQHLYLVREAKLAATALNCETILFALDNAVINNYILHEQGERFKKEFYDFIVPQWLSGKRVYSQTKILNFNVLGTDFMAHTLADKK
jgi:glucokinase